MKIARVEIEHFGCIRKALVELGPGLNVLYGPNDLGKSTIGSAIRTALLVPNSSSYASQFVPWESDEKPMVKLTLELPDGRFWRVEKRFGAGVGSSLLQESKDGTSFSVIKKAREVDEEIRRRLEWGIASPASKGAPRGLPTSFLAKVLLGEQTDVAGVLAQTLDQDTDDSGRGRLTTALAAFAQHPLFKEILDKAQANVDAAFTPTGRKRSVRSSPFRQVTDEVKRVKAHFDQVKRRVEESETAKRELERLQDELGQQEERLEFAAEAEKKIRYALEQDAARQEVEAQLVGAKAVLADQQRQVDALCQAESQLGEASKALSEAKAVRETLEASERELGEKVRAAEEAVRLAMSAEAEKDRQIRRGELEKRKMELDAALKAAETELGIVRKARAAHQSISVLERDLEQTVGHRDGLREGAHTLEAQRLELERQLQVAAVAVGLARLREVEAEIAAMAEVGQAVDGERARANDARLRSDQLLADLPSDVPSQEVLAGIEKLHNELGIAEARLGGHFAVTVERLREVALSARVDGSQHVLPQGGDASLECGRELELRIGDYARVKIVAGARDALEHARSLRDRWATEAAPVLERMSLPDVAALATRVDAISEQRSRAEELASEAQRLDAQADLRAEQLVNVARLEQERDTLREEIGSEHRSPAEEMLGRLGGKPIDAHRKDLERQKRAVELSCNETREQLQTKETDTKVLESRLETSRAQYADLGKSEPESGWEQRESELERNLSAASSQRARVEQELAELVDQQNAELSTAEEKLREAQAARESVESELSAAKVAVGDLQGQADRLWGSIETQRERVKKLDVPTCQVRVVELQSRLAALPVPEKSVTVDDANAVAERVAEARRLRDAAKDDCRKAEGALQTVGGQVVMEQEREAKEALRMAELKERDVEVDYDAWKLLAEKLREAENSEGQHLGEALSQPVTEKFAELTNNRYGKLEVAPDLRAEGVKVAGVLQDVALLSVGTQEQLATLLRLTVAEQLGSMLVLDDHLSQTDPDRSKWFKNVLEERAGKIQIIVLTCRPRDYLAECELPANGQANAIAKDGLVRAVNIARSLESG